MGVACVHAVVQNMGFLRHTVEVSPLRCHEVSFCKIYRNFIILFNKHRGDKEEATTDNGVSHV